MRDRLVAATCDDGYAAAGFAALLTELSAASYKVRAGATERAWTSNGTATGFTDPLQLDHLESVRHIVAGTPTNVYSASPASVARHLMGKVCDTAMLEPINALIAGVNHGPNVGADLIHSGTFGAALSATWLGLPAIAVSLDDVHSVDETAPGELQFALAARAGRLALDWLTRQDTCMLVNLNIPNSISAGMARFAAATPHSSNKGTIMRDVEALRSKTAAVTVFLERDLGGDTTASQALADDLTRCWAT
jgi:5'-nucleotidase